MQFILKHFDTPLLDFEADPSSSDTTCRITRRYPGQEGLLPLGMEPSDAGLERWLRRRTIPRNRAYVDALLSKTGLSVNRPLGIVMVCKGLSLNDCYWVDTPGSQDTYDQINWYDNRFSRVLAEIAFTGYGSSVRTSLASCPEFTTNGMLPKCWRRRSGRIYLYKGGTSGAGNTGFEPYSELYASQIAQAMGVNAVRYTLTMDLKKTLCSRCELFTSKARSFVPAAALVRSNRMADVRSYYAALGPAFTDALDDMLVFDAVICNTDRHYGNFGLMVDNQTNRICAPAPLFDHGNALFNLAGPDVWADPKRFEQYVSAQLPRVYDDFFAEARAAIQPRHHAMLRRLLNFRFDRRASRYNLPPQRLHVLEQEVRRRARCLLNG